jgi:outer membrane protein OmpA-like peptidoglycan-associated protein
MRITLPLGAGVLLSICAFTTAARAQGGPEEEPMPPSMPDTAALQAPAMPAADESLSASMTPGQRPASSTEPNSVLPSLMGPVGLYHMSTAEVGPVNHLRLGLHGQWFKSSDFLIRGDANTRVDGTLTFGFTPHRYVEIFGALLTSSNRNQRTNEAGRRDPELIKSFGDLVLGPKVSVPVAAGSTLGFELGLRFLSSISDLSFSPSSTSVWVGPIYTLDLRRVAEVPLRFHANANYYVDNSGNLFDFSNTTIYTREVAMFAYGIAASRMRFAIGVDAPLEKLTAPVPLQPFAEYHAEIVTGKADAAFAGLMPDNRDQQWLTFGLRARVYQGISVDAGADVRLRSVGYQYGPPLPPYNVVFGLNYALDVDSFRRPVVVTKTVERTIAPPPPEEGRIAGAIRDKDGKPIPGAIVAVKGRPRSRVATDPDGTFLTAPLPPGPAELEVTAPNFENDSVRTKVTAGTQPVEVKVALTAKVLTGNVRGHIVDSQGQGLQATIRFAGVEAFEAKSDQNGAFSAALPAGPYKVTAEVVGMPKKEAPLDIAAGQDRALDLTIRPANPDVSLSGDAITLRQPIKFKSGPPKLDPKLQGELDAVADLLADHPEIRTLRVEAHWDASAGTKAQDLTGKQAGVVKDYLIKKGVPEGRVQAVGMGADKPLVPNIGPANKAKNRRVELHTSN